MQKQNEAQAAVAQLLFPCMVTPLPALINNLAVLNATLGIHNQ
jgi:hypothetical protein